MIRENLMRLIVKRLLWPAQCRGQPVADAEAAVTRSAERRIGACVWVCRFERADVEEQRGVGDGEVEGEVCREGWVEGLREKRSQLTVCIWLWRVY